MKITKLNKGFTLIELLVVIAIIGILSTIVLTSLSSSRVQAEDAKIKSTLNNMRAQAQLFYSTNSNKFSNTTTFGNATALGAATGENGCDIAANLFGIASTTNANTVDTLIEELKTNTGQTVADTKIRCSTGLKYWAVAAKLKTGNDYHCIDSTGDSRKLTGATFDSIFPNTGTLKNKCN